MILYLGNILHMRSAPLASDTGKDELEFYPEGALATDELGKIQACGPARDLRARFASARIVDFGNRWILPGFVDAHIHFPQMSIVGSYGKKLLDWLADYTYPEESKYQSRPYCVEKSRVFFERLLQHGTTLSAVYTTTHFHSADLLFEAAERSGVRAIIGKVSMDRFAPEVLLQNAVNDRIDNEKLIQKWHGKDNRLYCALTPRFAISCTPELMRQLGELKKKYPSVYVQTHFAESREEIAEVARQFPKSRDYLTVYDEFGFLGPQTLLAHCVHPSENELRLLSQRKPSIAHCPTSNTFFGAGLFPLDTVAQTGCPIALGSDIGGGTTLSMCANAVEAYKVQKLRGSYVSPASLFYMATLGGARSLGMDDKIGNFIPGKEADFVIVDWAHRPELIERLEEREHSAEETLFTLALYATPDAVEEVFVRGKSVYRRAASSRNNLNG